MRSPFRRSRAQGAALVVAGIVIFLGLELFEEPDASSLDLLPALIEIASVVLISAGVFLFLGASGKQ